MLVTPESLYRIEIKMPAWIQQLPFASVHYEEPVKADAKIVCAHTQLCDA